MAQKIRWFLLACVIYSGHNCYGSNDSIKENAGTFEYEILELQLDYLKSSVHELSEKTNKQSTLLEQLVSTNANQNKNSIDKQTSLIHQLITIVNSTNHILDTRMNRQDTRSCKLSHSTGLYKLVCYNCPTGTTVLCEMESFAGGWLVIQQRLDGSVNFTRGWQEYRSGFGSVGEAMEFWLGLELLHVITNSGQYELIVEIKNEEGMYGFARYADFKIAGEKDKSHLGDYHGTIGDQLRAHKSRKFSTFDQDNDEQNHVNCSQFWFSGGGWWYKECAYSALNGAYTKNEMGFGINWYGYSSAAMFSRMMIRRK